MTASSINRRIETRLGSIALTDEGSGTPVLLWPSLFSDHRLFSHVHKCSNLQTFHARLRSSKQQYRITEAGRAALVTARRR